MDIRINPQPGFLPAKLVNELAFHGFDCNGRRKAEVLAPLQQAVVTVVFFIQGDEPFLLKVFDREGCFLKIRMPLIDNDVHSPAEHLLGPKGLA